MIINPNRARRVEVRRIDDDRVNIAVAEVLHGAETDRRIGANLDDAALRELRDELTRLLPAESVEVTVDDTLAVATRLAAYQAVTDRMHVFITHDVDLDAEVDFLLTGTRPATS